MDREQLIQRIIEILQSATEKQLRLIYIADKEITKK
jgi:hypothetical protein